MPDLTELQRLAEGATPGPWDAFTGGAGTVYSRVRLPTMSRPRAVCQCPSSRTDRTRSHADIAYIAAMHPDTAKKLIAVALAALDLDESVMSLALVNALEELK